MIDKLVVHCSASPQGRGDTAATIHKWHRQNDWHGIGYHRVVLEDGTVENGRPDYWQGAHTRGHNENSLGVCLIGEGGDATSAQLAALAGEIIAWLWKYPDATVLGHRDLNDGTECPGFDVTEWWTSICK